MVLIIVIFGIPIYLQFCGIDGDFFNNFLLIYSSIIGGLITLAGVAWTIKDAEKNRKKDEENREKNRHAENIKKYMPYLMVKQLNLNLKHEVINLELIDISKLENNTNYIVNFKPLFLKNSDNSNIIIKTISIDNLKITLEKFVEKNDYLLIKFPIIHKENFIIMFEVLDLIGNVYYYELRYLKHDWPSENNFEVEYDNLELKNK